MAFYESIGFEVYLSPKSECGYCGVEKCYLCKNKIKLYKDEYDSYRFIKFVNNKPVSVIQLMKTDSWYMIANLFTLKEYRQKGYAKELFFEAKRKLNVNKIYHSNNLSSLGKIFADKVN